MCRVGIDLFWAWLATLTKSGISRIIMPIWCTRFSDFSWQTINDSTFLYDQLSGDTHVLNFIAFALLGALQQGALDQSQLYDRVRVQLGLSADDLPDALLVSCCADLDRAGLLYPDRAGCSD